MLHKNGHKGVTHKITKNLYVKSHENNIGLILTDRKVKVEGPAGDVVLSDLNSIAFERFGNNAGALGL
jgi:hypothetical protein